MMRYRTKDIAKRCGISTGDAAAMIRLAGQAGRFGQNDVCLYGSGWEISEAAYQEIFGGLEVAFRDLKQAEADAKHEQLAANIAKRERQIRARIVTAATGRPESGSRMGMRARTPYKFRHRDGASIRLFGPVRERVAL